MVKLSRFLFLFSLLPAFQLNCLLLPDSKPFSSQYAYYTAQAKAKDAENCLQDFHFQCAFILYKDAHQLLAQSMIEDEPLSFRIDVGLALSDAFKDEGVVLRHRLEAIYKKFASNPPPVKIQFDTGGDINVCESVYEAQ